MAKETANNGFIKIDRCILDWQHFTEPVLVQVFIYLLVKANHKEGWWKGHKCERGATMVSIRTMCDDLAMSAHTAIKALRTLESSGEIKRIMIDQKTSKTIITKYSQYQDVNLFSVANSATQSATQTATQSATKQERKERKEDKERDNKNTHTHEEILNEWMNSRITLEAFCKNEHITPEQFEQIGKAVINEWAMTGETGTNDNDTRKKMLAHIRAKAQAMRGYLVGAEDEAKRQQPLINDCKALIAKGYDKPLVQKFYKCYTQKTNDGSGRMLFESLGAWDSEFKFKEFLKRERK